MRNLVITAIVLLGANYVMPSDVDCPVGHYRCRSQVKKCIQLDEICDGMADCPNGEDELTSYCKPSLTEKNYQNYNPGKSYVNDGEKYVKMTSKSDNGQNQSCNAGKIFKNFAQIYNSIIT